MYVWGNYLHETGSDRLPAWLEPEALSGGRVFVHQSVTMTDEEPLRVDASRTIFAVGGDERYLPGRDLGDPDGDWRVAYIRVATDGTREGAAEFVGELLELIEMDEMPEHAGRQMPFGAEIVTSWEDPHGQWDMVLVRH
jgi:hypothetical protein